MYRMWCLKGSADDHIKHIGNHSVIFNKKIVAIFKQLLVR